ncbi:unnamed protein product [Rotaria magnacalcarata]|uniref:MULE transposase domain-containing protein n=1 Tax=Rotaria magnacalcarata TaxID=392030 RepID=A0A816MIT3_9BILA|nr:unnamed protein product [Rotaria magnacalcarata]
MKERILNETISLTKIYDEEIKKASFSDEATAALASVVEFRSNMSKTSRKNIPAAYQQTISGGGFLLMDSFLKRGFPVVFCLLPNRWATTYVELFERLKQEAIAMNPTLEPKRVVSDFESSLISAVQTVFPSASHSSCNFHFVQAVHRNIAAYKNDESIREQCRGLIVLSLMPVSEIEQQFKHIHALFLPSLTELFIYFERQWIKGNILLSLWNASESDHRTNNISEGMRKIYGAARKEFSYYQQTHPNIWKFIRLIQDEHAIFEHINIQVAYGAEMGKSNSEDSSSDITTVDLTPSIPDTQTSTYPIIPKSRLELKQKLVDTVLNMHCDDFKEYIAGDMKSKTFATCNLRKDIFRVPSYRSITSDYLPKLHQQITKRLKHAWSSTDFLSLTFYGWTDRRMRAFDAVTMHYIDRMGQLNAHLLTFNPLSGSHTGENLFHEYDHVSTTFSIGNKVFQLITDNASNNLSAFGELVIPGFESYFITEDDIAESDNDEVENELDKREELIRLPSFIHTLQLVVKDGLDGSGCTRSAMAKVTEIAKLSHKSIPVAEKLQEFKLSILLAVITRWNS